MCQHFRLILIVTVAWSLLANTTATSAPLYTNLDAGVPVTGPGDAALTKSATGVSGPPILPSYETEIENKRHKVFITIDDHPGRRTEQYLDLLKRYRLKATFFLVSYCLYGYLSRPTYQPVVRMVESLRRALREGHLLGNHSVSHRLMCQMDAKTAEWEVGKSQVWTKQVLGVDLKLWRPPHGHLCPLVQRTVARWGLVTVMWDVDDWRSTPESMVRIIKQRARRGHGSTIVLFHNKIEKIKKFLLLLPPVKNAP